jgi:hypothetical protein
LILRILITALAALLAPAGTALAALPQQSATVDTGDRVKGCEKRVNSKPQAASKKRRKKKKSSRAGR